MRVRLHYSACAVLCASPVSTDLSVGAARDAGWRRRKRCGTLARPAGGEPTPAIRNARAPTIWVGETVHMRRCDQQYLHRRGISRTRMAPRTTASTGHMRARRRSSTLTLLSQTTPCCTTCGASTVFLRDGLQTAGVGRHDLSRTNTSAVVMRRRGAIAPCCDVRRQNPSSRAIRL